MPAASQDPGLADGRTSGAVPAAELPGASRDMSAIGNRVLQLVGEWPASDVDYQHGDREPLGDRERILADRLAAALVHHEPGWRLPRVSTLARRHRVHASQVDHAIEELIHRRIIRRLPNGQLYRASPAEYLLSLEGVHGLASRVDPMGREIVGNSQILHPRCPEDVGHALGIASGRPVTLVKVMWTADGSPAGLTATYLADQVADLAEFAARELAPASATSPLMPSAENRAEVTADSRLRPGGLFIELQPPPPSVARSLRLGPGQPAAIIVVQFDDPGGLRPTALTVAALRADQFRIVIQSPDAPLGSANMSAPQPP